MAFHRTLATLGTLSALAALTACSGGDDGLSSGNEGGSGATESGGTTGSGATPATGGTTPATGGAPGVGGDVTTGGTSGTGAAPAAGGDTGTGAQPATGGTGGDAPDNPNAVVITCDDITYDAQPTQAGSCAGAMAAPALFATFEEGPEGLGVYANGTPGTTTVPASFMEGSVSVDTTGGADGSSASVHYAGSDFVDGIRFHNGFESCLDVGAYEGLSFWAKGSADAYEAWGVEADTLVVLLGSQNAVEGGDCASDCPNQPDARVTIDGEWKEYRVPFGCFGEQGVEATVFDGFLESVLISVRGSNFDVSIDQIGFY